MGGGKGVVWILIVAAVAVGGWYYWKGGNVVLTEPSIESQISAQLAADKNGASVPLPIPLAIGIASIDSLDTKTVASALGDAGFVEEKASIDTSQFTGSVDKKNISQKLFMNEQLGMTALILTIKGESGGTTVCFIANGAVDMLIPGAGKILAGSSDSSKAEKSSMPGGVGMGGLTLGMSEKQVRQAMEKVPHDSMGNQASLGLSPEEMNAYNDALQNVMTLSRGRYTYLLRFNDKALAAVIVMDMGPLFESVSLKDEKKEALIRMMFDK